MADLSPVAAAYKQEYMFKRLVDYFNAIPNGPKVTTSMARELRLRLNRSMVAASPAFQKLKDQHTQEADEALSQLNPFATVSGRDMASRMIGILNGHRVDVGGGRMEPIKGVQQMFQATVDTSVQPPKPSKQLLTVMRKIGEEFDRMYENGVIPVSPYDPTVATRDAFLNAGRACLYTSREALEAGSDSIAARLDQATLSLYARSTDVGDDKKRLKTSATVADRTGFSRLRPYMSADEYRAVSAVLTPVAWNMRQSVYVKDKARVPTNDREKLDRARTERAAALRRGVDKDKLRGGEVILDRAEAVLKMLRDEGIPFSVRANAYDGQVILEFANKMELRLIDTRSPQYSGIRMYQDGRRMFLKADRHAYTDMEAFNLAKGAGELPEAASTVSAPEEVRKKLGNIKYVPHLNASPEECVTFVKYCLGRPVNTLGPESRPVGSVRPPEVWYSNETYKNGVPKLLYKSVNTGKHFYADMGSFSYEGQSYGLCVDVDSTDRTAIETTRQPDGEHAREWLINSVSSARENFVRAVDIDGLVLRYQAALESGDMSAPAFAADEDIAFIQRQYWDILTGAQQTLVRPGHDLEGDDGDLLADATYDVRTDPATGARVVVLNGQTYDVSVDPNNPTTIPYGRVQMLRAHLSESLEQNFGQFEKSGPDGKRFNPAYVARFMDSSNSLYRNIDDIVVAAKAYMADTMPTKDREGNVKPPKINDSFTPDDLRGDDFTTNSVRERLVVFDEMKAASMAKSNNPFIQKMGKVIRDAIQSNGCVVSPDEIEIDEQGVVRYRAWQICTGTVDMSANKYPLRPWMAAGLPGGVKYFEQKNAESLHMKPVIGYIGRVIAPDENGMVFDGKYNHVPCYLGVPRPNRFGEESGYESRMILRGYEQVMTEAIRNRIRSDTMDARTLTGDSTGIDNVLRHLYDTKYPADFEKRIAEMGMNPELAKAIIATNGQRVKIEAAVLDKANRVDIYNSVSGGLTGGSFDGQNVNFDPLVDNDMSAVTLAGGRNMAINDVQGDGIFDHMVTGNGGAQGVRYLVNGAKVASDGHIIPAEVPYRMDESGKVVKDLSKMPRCALAEYVQSTGRMIDYDAVDRGNMTVNGLLHCMRETDRVGVAQVSFGGWTLEDGLVVSKRFAETYTVPDAHESGKMRSLMEGDKVECHGNKGVISIVIDPDMSDAEAAEKGILKQVQWMRANPGVEVVMAPYSHVSRFNAGLGAEAMGLGVEVGVDPSQVEAPTDMVNLDGSISKGCVGHAKFTILEQTADVKTHFEEDGSPKRSYGAQAGWALAAADCPSILSESFEDNTKSLVELRELLITCGMDISGDGHLMKGYQPQGDEKRNIVPVRPLCIMNSNGRRVIHASKTADAFMDEIAKCGGFAEIPFQLEFPRFKVPDDYDFAEGAYNKEGFTHSRCEKGNKATLGFLEPVPLPTDGKRTFGQKMFGQTYKLPVVSASMRSGQEFEDGKVIYHEWSNAYKNIYRKVAKFQAFLYGKMYPSRGNPDFAQISNQGEFMMSFNGWLEAQERSLSPEKFKSLEKEIERERQKYQHEAQIEFDKITQDIVTRKFEGKHNIFRTGIMANKQVNSATAVWTGDPRRGIDEVGMNPNMMKALGVKEGEYVMIHRDPVLRDGGMRYMKAIADPRLAGISVNPAGVPKCMDGDFDGDTIGVHKLSTEEANREAMKHLSVYANLLDAQAVDQNSWDPATRTYSRRKLSIAGGQDVAAGIAANPKLQEHYDRIEDFVNRFEHAASLGKISEEKLMACRKQAVGEINKFLTSCYDEGFGRHVISYESPEAHLQSILDYTNDKAKGGPGKVQTYAANLGMTVEFDADKKHVTNVERDPNGVYTDSVRNANTGILQAKNMQTEYTGFGGMFSIRAVRALYNVEPKTALELTYLATQAVLQVKHDAEMADKYEQMLSGPARWVWQGYKLEKTEVELRSMKSTGEIYVDPKTGEKSERMEMVTSKVPGWKKALDDKGRPIVATHKEFVQQFMDIYGSKDGMGLELNKEFVNRLGLLLAADYNPKEPMPSPENKAALEAYWNKIDNSKMMNIETKAVERYGAPLQRLAYGAKMKDVAELALANAGLFDVPTATDFRRNYNACMADAGIMRKNLEAVRQGKEPTEVIARPDVLVNGEQRRSKAMMGVKLAQAVHERGYKAEAARAEDKRVNTDRMAGAMVEADQSTAQSAQQATQVQQPAAPNPAVVNHTVDEVMSGKVRVEGAFGVPGPSEAQQVQKGPQAPGMTFPNTQGVSIPEQRNGVPFGFDLSAQVPQDPQQAQPEQVRQQEAPELPKPTTQPGFTYDEELGIEIPTAFLENDGFEPGYMREIPDTSDIEMNGNGNGDGDEDNFGVPW